MPRKSPVNVPCAPYQPDCPRWSSTRRARTVPLNPSIPAPEREDDEPEGWIDSLPEHLLDFARRLADGEGDRELRAAGYSARQIPLLRADLRRVVTILAGPPGARPGDSDRLLARWERDAQPSTPPPPYRPAQTSSGYWEGHATPSASPEPDRATQYAAWWLHHADDTPAPREPDYYAARDARWEQTVAKYRQRGLPASLK